MSWEEVRLFDVPPLPDDGIELDERLSPTRRLTRRRKMLLARGIHPATLLPLREGATCGSCAHHVVTNGGNRWYHKCALVPHTNGPGTDIRTSWPACTSWAEEPRT